VIATVREWRDEEGWGIVSTEEIPDIFVHFSNIEMDGYKSLKPGQRVEIELVGPLALVEGCRYAGAAVRPVG
jgi:cold shock protein